MTRRTGPTINDTIEEEYEEEEDFGKFEDPKVASSRLRRIEYSKRMKAIWFRRQKWENRQARIVVNETFDFYRDFH